MYAKINSKYPRVNGKYLSLRHASLQYITQGPAALNWNYVENDPYSPTTPVRPQGYIRVDSYKSNKVTVNFGDGVIETYEFKPSGIPGQWYWGMYSQIGSPPPFTTNNAMVENHVFVDGQTGRRVVTFTFEDPESIFYITNTLYRIYDNYPSDIDKFTLNNLQISNSRFITNFPYTLANITSLETLFLNTIGPLLSTYPDSFLGLTGLKNLTMANVVNFSNQGASGLAKLGQHTNLENLNIGASMISGDLPVEFLNLTNLTILDTNSNLFVTTPNRIKQMTWLTSISMGGGFAINNSFITLGDLSTLTELSRISVVLAPNWDGALPINLQVNEKFKLFTIYSSLQSQVRIDNFVNDMYTFVTTYAPMTGTSSDRFRNMQISAHQSTRPELNYRPSGTYQQPIGYVQGVSNGTPASPLEKIWVMNAQYAHSWSIKPE